MFEGNIIKDIGQLVQFYKPAIQLSQSYSTVRRNVVMNSKSNALEVSALNNSTAATIWFTTTCFIRKILVSSSPRASIPPAASAAYDGDVYVNNICYPITSLATDIYLANTTNVFTNNDLLAVDASGAAVTKSGDRDLEPQRPKGRFNIRRAVAYADRNYSPPFARTKV